MRTALIRFILKTQHLPFLRTAYRALYTLGRWIIVRALSRVPGVQCIYTRGGVRGDIGVPGISDVDVVLGTAFTDKAQQLDTLDRLTRRYVLLNTFIPFFKDIYSAPVDKLVLFHSLKAQQLGKREGDYFAGRFRWSFGTDPLQAIPPYPVPEVGWYELAVRRYRDLCVQCGYALNSGYLRNVTHYARQITQFLRRAGVPTGSDTLPALLRAVEQVERRHFFEDANRSGVTALWSSALAAVNDISLRLDPLGPTEGVERDRTYELAPLAGRVPGKGEAIEHLQHLADRLENTADIDAFLLSYEDYTFRHVPIILLGAASRSEPNETAVGRVVDLLRRSFPDEPRADISLPLLLSTRTFARDSDRLIFPHGLVEPFYLARHGHVFFGEGQIPSWDPVAWQRIMAGFIPWQRIHHFCLARPLGANITERLLWGILKCDPGYLGHWLRVLFTYLPARRLLIERRVIATTGEEAYRAYVDHFSDERLTARMIELNEERVDALRGGELVRWAERRANVIHEFADALEDLLLVRVRAEQQEILNLHPAEALS